MFQVCLVSLFQALLESAYWESSNNLTLTISFATRSLYINARVSSPSLPPQGSVAGRCQFVAEIPLCLVRSDIVHQIIRKPIIS